MTPCMIFEGSGLDEVPNLQMLRTIVFMAEAEFLIDARNEWVSLQNNQLLRVEEMGKFKLELPGSDRNVVPRREGGS